MLIEDAPRRRQSLTRLAVRAGRRQWRRVRRRLRGHNVQLVSHEAYQWCLPEVPIDPRRAERIQAFLLEEGLLDRHDIRAPWRVQVRALLRVHDSAYLESLQQPEVLERVFGAAVSDEQLASAIEMQRMMVGGTILASRLALRDGGVVVNLGGGLHHATRDSGMGFCLFNDVAVAIARLRANGFSGRVLVIDLDMHDGNGTRAIFARDPTVYTYSLHAGHWGPTEAVADTAIALGDEVDDERLLGTLLKTLPDVVESFEPALAVYIAGTDPAADDLRGSWRMTPAGVLSRDRFVVGLLRDRGRTVPVVVVLGGGYGDRSWRYTARLCGWLMAGRAIEPPADEELLLQRFRTIGRSLEPAALMAEPDWRLSEDDLAGIVPASARPTRFLGYFSKHGVELVLERFGLLDQLRLRGYDEPCVELDLDHPLGQNLRIFGDADRTELLVELRVSRGTQTVPGCELLVIEWLLLQHPRAQFGPYRQPLPGQTHPGLGMLKDVLGWLMVVCEMLSLDGIYYVPSTYHVVARSRMLVRFLRPEHEARYRAVQQAVAGLDLAVASQAISDERIVDGAGRPVGWEASPMVLPVSDRLKQLVLGEEYERQVAEELARLHFHLAEPGPSGPSAAAGASA